MAFDPSRDLDDVDWAILEQLQDDGRLAFSELARRVNLSPPAVTERVRRLEQAGVITGYRAQVDSEALGLGISALVRVRVALADYDRFLEAIVARPEVVDCDHVTGEDCMVVRVRTPDVRRLEQVVGAIGRYGPTTTSLVFSNEVRDRPVTRAELDGDGS